MSAWSYSSLTAYETCPRRYKLTRVTKEVREPQTEATTHGNEVHKALELHVKNEAYLPKKYEKYIPIAESIKQSEGRKVTEMKWAVNQQLRPVEFFAKDAWARGVFDVAIMRPKSVTVLDYKTGKPKTDSDQLKLFAAAAFSHYSYANVVRTGYAWLAYDRLDTEKFERAQAPAIWQEFLPRVNQLEKSVRENSFPPRPSGLCKAWCPVTQKQCEYSGKLP